LHFYLFFTSLSNTILPDILNGGLIPIIFSCRLSLKSIDFYVRAYGLAIAKLKQWFCKPVVVGPNPTVGFFRIAWCVLSIA